MWTALPGKLKQFRQHTHTHRCVRKANQCAGITDVIRARGHTKQDSTTSPAYSIQDWQGLLVSRQLTPNQILLGLAGAAQGLIIAKSPWQEATQAAHALACALADSCWCA
eukprot:6475239-Amphidinium_carterae.1